MKPAWEVWGRALSARPRVRLGRLPLPPAAVLVPLFEDGDGVHVVLTRRPDSLSKHPGQVAFPGGKMEEGEDTLTTALREAHEEVGIPPESVEVLGELAEVPTTAFRMTPWVGRISADVELVPEPGEVARVFTVPLSVLADPARSGLTWKPWSKGGRTFQIPYFHYDGEVIWGATGRVLVDLLGVFGVRLRPEEA